MGFTCNPLALDKAIKLCPVYFRHTKRSKFHHWFLNFMGEKHVGIVENL
jgi:hypothetical protein